MQKSQQRRRHALRALALGALAGAAPWAWAQKRAEPIAVEVWKDASCGCCGDWIAHMEQYGF